MNQSPKNPKKVIVVLRWIAVLPAAVFASIVVHLLVILINDILIVRYVDFESFLAQVYIHLVANIPLGAAGIWVAAYVAPTFKKHVSTVMVGLFLLLSGAVILWSIMQERYWDIYAIICMNIGSIGMAVHLFMKEQKQVEESGVGGFEQEKAEMTMGSQFDNLMGPIVMQYAERGEGTGGVSKILSGLMFPILTVLAVQMIKDQQYIPLFILAILMWTKFGSFVMVAGLIYFFVTEYWIGAGILSVYFLVSILSMQLGKKNIKRLLLSGNPMISPFESMPDLLLILVLECLFLAVALFTHDWFRVLFLFLFGLIVLYHLFRYWFRLHPRWSQVHQPLMVRYAGFAGQEMGQAGREGREFDFFVAIRLLIKSVYPSKKDEEIETILVHAAEKMDLFLDRDLIKQAMQKRNPYVLEDTVRNLLDKVETHLQAEEGRNKIVRYAIAEIVEAVFGPEERGVYLLAVIEGKAN